MLFKRREKREKRKVKRKGRIKIFLRSREEVRLRKAFPRGLCPAQRIRIYMTAGGSHTATKWLPARAVG